MAKGKPGRKPETFAERVARLRVAVEAAKTIKQFDKAREQIRSAFGIAELNQTDLWAVCERKRIELGYELRFESEADSLTPVEE